MYAAWLFELAFFSILTSTFAAEPASKKKVTFPPATPVKVSVFRQIPADFLAKIEAERPNTACTPEFKEISLEKEKISEDSEINGPFFGVARDHQDGLGTCFGNTAKNLLLCITKGSADASYLDLTLQYQIQQNRLGYDGLDGGSAAIALQSIKKTGYCPKKYSPMETGEALSPIVLSLSESNGVGSGAEKKDFINIEANILKKMNDYISNKGALERNKTIPAHADLRGLIPVLKKYQRTFTEFATTGVENYKIEEFFYSNQKKIIDVKGKEIRRVDFLKAYYSEFSKMREQLFIKINNQAPTDEIVHFYIDGIRAWTSKNWGIDKARLNDLESNIRSQIEGIRNNPTKMAEIEDFRKLTAGIAPNCASLVDTWDGLAFLKSFQGLLNELQWGGLSEEVIFGKDQANDDATLLQLAIAPECLDPKNRIAIADNFESYTDLNWLEQLDQSETLPQDKLSLFRARLAISLKQGLAVGRSLKSQNHIHTIIGLRFNKENMKCEYQIRESQTGESYWQDEALIFKDTKSLTEVFLK